MTLAEIAEAVGGRLTTEADPQARVTGSVELDSRKIRPGGLFVAFAGDHADGHDFARRAVSDGAVAVLAAREVGVAAIVVDDVQYALGRLARAVVDRAGDLTVIGITGSSGKTSTKDVIALLCRDLGPTVAPLGNLNNEIGMPFTVCKVEESTRYLVVEMGARRPGNITYLCGIAPPDIGVVVNVGTAHLGEMGSVDNIVLTKGELAEAAAADGAVVLNADDAKVWGMRPRARARVVGFGTAAEADFRATDVVVEAGRARYTLTTPTGSAPVSLPLYGAHQVANTLAAAAVADRLGMPLERVAELLSGQYTLSSRRMELFDADGVTVIDDSYNANPASVSAALAAQADIAGDRRTIAVLGYMAELGDDEAAEHRRMGELAAQHGVDVVISVEDAAAPIAQGAEAKGVTAWATGDQAAAIERLDRVREPGDVILVKASRYRTWKVADHLRDADTTDREAQA